MATVITSAEVTTDRATEPGDCWYCRGSGKQDAYVDSYSTTLTKRDCVACGSSGRMAAE